MNIHPNEALAYAQSSHGIRFVSGVFVGAFPGIDPFADTGQHQKSAKSAKTYYYKVPAYLPEIEPGDLVIVQVLDKGFSILKVNYIDDEPPASDEYDYVKALKWVVGLVPKAESEALTQADRDALKSISRASLRSRIREMNEALGFDVSEAISPVLGTSKKDRPVGREMEEVEEVEEGKVIEEYPTDSIVEYADPESPFERGSTIHHDRNKYQD